MARGGANRALRDWYWPPAIYYSYTFASVGDRRCYFSGPYLIGVHHDGHNRREGRRTPLAASVRALAGKGFGGTCSFSWSSLLLRCSARSSCPGRWYRFNRLLSRWCLPIPLPLFLRSSLEGHWAKSPAGAVLRYPACSRCMVLWSEASSWGYCGHVGTYPCFGVGFGHRPPFPTSLCLS